MNKNKSKSKSSRQYILLAGLFVALAGLFIAMLFMFWDLGHTIELLGYKKISSAEDLKAISQDPSGKYCLSKDIDLQGVEWTPISFNGILDGNGHEIRNLTLTAPGNNVRDTYDGNMKSYSTSLAGLFDVPESLSQILQRPFIWFDLQQGTYLLSILLLFYPCCMP